MSVRGTSGWLVVPVSLLGACIAGTALIMVLLLVPNADFHGIDQAAKGWVEIERSQGSAQRELPVRAIPSTARSRAAVALDGLPETGEHHTEAARKRALRDRVAANILLRSGLLESALATCEALPPPPTIRYEMRLREEPWLCADLAPPTVAELPTDALSADGVTPDPLEAPNASTDIDRAERIDAARRMALAAVAVEKTYRNAAQRWLELRMAGLVLAVRGRLPDLSLGPAQMRPSTLQALPAHAEGIANVAVPDDHALLDALGDECRALKFATFLFYHLLSDPSLADDNVPEERAAARYVGRKAGTTATPAVIDYPPIVAAAARLVPPASQ